MPRSKRGTQEADAGGPAKPVNLRTLADHLGLSPATLSLVLNDSPGAKAIPQETKERIFEAARRFNYRPNPIARSLRSQRTHTIGVLLPDLSDPYSALVLSGIEDYLIQQRYFFFIASHRHDGRLIDQYTQLFVQRCVEGLVVVDTPPQAPSHLPVVAVSRHDDIEGVTNIILDHERAATLALEHLVALGHRQIAVFKGQSFSSDTEERFLWIKRVASRLGVRIRPGLVEQLEGEDTSPEPGYVAARKLLDRGEPFTALFAFNDTSAIGAIRTFREAGLRVPEDVSVVGFDDWHGAAFHNPPLTTIRQPLAQMGKLSAEILLRRIAGGPAARYESAVMVEPELVVRQSTTAARAASSARTRA